MDDLVVINCQAYFYTFLSDLFVICHELCKGILTFNNEENVDQTMIDQFSEIAQGTSHEPSIGKHMGLKTEDNKSYKF